MRRTSWNELDNQYHGYVYLVWQTVPEKKLLEVCISDLVAAAYVFSKDLDQKTTIIEKRKVTPATMFNLTVTV